MQFCFRFFVIDGMELNKINILAEWRQTDKLSTLFNIRHPGTSASEAQTKIYVCLLSRTTDQSKYRMTVQSDTTLRKKSTNQKRRYQ